MKRIKLVTALVALAALMLAGAADAQDDANNQKEKPGSVGVRFGVGTDITGGIAVGGQVNYTLFQLQNAIEMGLAVFGGKFEEESDNGFNTYNETTDILVIGAMVNYLFRYSRESSAVYFVGGAGAGAISVEWEETSDTDVSLGTPLPNGGSMQSEDGTVGGLILNFGLGYRFSEKFDLRGQVPVFFISGGDERDGQVVPLFSITAGLNF
jgi:hypothetical protein